MSAAFTIADARLWSGGRFLDATRVRVADGRIAAIGGCDLDQPGETVIDGQGATLLPGLIDAHIHLVPGATQLAVLFGVTTVLDMFSKPDVINPERAAIAAAQLGHGPACADLITSSIGATAPGGHPSAAYAPLPYVTGPTDAAEFVAARQAEGALHIKIIYDDGSGALLNIPTLDAVTIRALVQAAHNHDLLAVAHVSTAAGAILTTRCGVDVLAHVPRDLLTPLQVAELAEAGLAVIATLDVVDGFPTSDGVMPLLGEPALAARIPPRWRRVLERQTQRWRPPTPPDPTAAAANVAALHAAGVPVLAGTDAPNPGLIHGASLHRELQHLVTAGLSPGEALTAATAAPAQVFGLSDRGVIEPGARADLLLVAGDPTTDLSASQAITQVWVNGRPIEPSTYAGSPAEKAGVAWHRAMTGKILQAITATWPDIPAPEDVRRADGELAGQVIPTGDGWQPTTVFGAPLGPAAAHGDAVTTVRNHGLAALAEPWLVRVVGAPDWREARLLEVTTDRVRLRWTDPLADQPASGQWYDFDDLDLSRQQPRSTTD